MNCDIIENKIIKAVKSKEVVLFSDEEYFYLVGQLLTAVFLEIGGFDKYRKEFNFLTNPYLPRNIFEIKKRILNFLQNSRKLINVDSTDFKTLYDMLLNFNIKSNSNSLYKLEDTFYEGLYAENIIIKHKLLK